MFNVRTAAEAVSCSFLLLTAPLFAQAPNGWPFAGNDLNNSRWASAETILNNQNVSGLTSSGSLRPRTTSLRLRQWMLQRGTSIFPIGLETCIS